MHLSFFRSSLARVLVASLPAVMVAAAWSPTAAADGATPATARVYQHLLERFDANKDGRLQTSELSPGALERIGAADGDHDGVITPDELHAFGVKRRAMRFARADKNGDGKLMPAEVGADKWEHLKVADANHDGALTLDEIEGAIASGVLRGMSAEDEGHE